MPYQITSDAKHQIILISREKKIYLDPRQILAENYSGVNGQFTKDMNLKAVSKGIYFLTVNADGQKVIRKIVIK